MFRARAALIAAGARARTGQPTASPASAREKYVRVTLQRAPRRSKSLSPNKAMEGRKKRKFMQNASEGALRIARALSPDVGDGAQTGPATERLPPTPPPREPWEESEPHSDAKDSQAWHLPPELGEGASARSG